MFKGLMLSAVMVLAASEAMASKARMTALGQNAVIGSQYLMDSRNVFHNPAYVNGLGGTFQVETGTGDDNASGAATPNPEGGFFQAAGDGVFGLWLGGDSGASRAMRAAASANFLAPDNTFEVFYGGKGGVDWGVSFYMSSSSEELSAVKKAQSTMGLRAGASTEQWDAAVVLGLGDTASVGDDDTYAGGSGMLITAGYNLGDSGKVYFNMNSGTATAEVAAVESEQAFSNMGLGYARTWSMDTGTFFYSAEYRTTSSGKDDPATTTGLPITVGMEKEATSWLTLRGSVSQPVLVNSTTNTPAVDDKGFTADATVVSAGAGLNFDGVMLDAVLAGASGSTNTGVVNANNLFGQVSFTYNY